MKDIVIDMLESLKAEMISSKTEIKTFTNCGINICIAIIDKKIQRIKQEVQS